VRLAQGGWELAHNDRVGRSWPAFGPALAVLVVLAAVTLSLLHIAHRHGPESAVSELPAGSW